VLDIVICGILAGISMSYEGEYNKGFVQSAFGFRSIIPKSRKERLALRDKVALEKSRIDCRVGFAARMHQKNAPATSAMLTQFEKGGAGYISNSDRFHTDTSGEELQVRKEKYRKELEAVEYRRGKAIMREETRWKAHEDQMRIDEEKIQNVRNLGIKAKKNKSAVAYDITTTQYNQDVEGVEQKYVDDMIRYRAKVRTHLLSKAADTRVNYNIISGGDRWVPPMPSSLPRPETFYDGKPDVDQRKVL
jgi:hypothetical protein